MTAKSESGVNAVGWLPWWCRPSLMLLGASLPALIIFSYSDSRQTLSKAQLFYGDRDFILGIFAILLLAAGARIGESGLIGQIGAVLSPRSRNRLESSVIGPR
ncbi:MAG: hypothetical protein ABL994_20380, partial [Verrucomicrobiales bacterium]